MSVSQGGVSKGTFQTYTALNAVTADGNSESYPVGGASRLTCEFTRANHSSGSSEFFVEGSVDEGATWHALELLAHDGSKTRAGSVTLSSNGSALHSVDLEHTVVQLIRVRVDETTDGTHTAKIVVEF